MDLIDIVDSPNVLKLQTPSWSRIFSRKPQHHIPSGWLQQRHDIEPWRKVPPLNLRHNVVSFISPPYIHTNTVRAQTIKHESASGPKTGNDPALVNSLSLSLSLSLCCCCLHFVKISSRNFFQTLVKTRCSFFLSQAQSKSEQRFVPLWVRWDILTL